MTTEMVLPPSGVTEEGRPRKIGVEIEFSGVSCEDAAGLVRELYGGNIRSIDAYRFDVIDTCFGAFTVELDSQYAHPADGGSDSPEGKDGIGRVLRDGVSAVIAAVTSLWLPVEIVSPPVPLTALPELDRLVPELRRLGAEDTSEGLVYAFATQLNPEVPSRRCESVLAHLRAFLLLAERLRKAIDMDLLRRALPFANPFPEAYVRKVLDPAYRPSLFQLVDDYLEANPTRNRELDLLPLLSELAPERVRAKVDDPLIKSRPTFHYRLPDTRLSDPSWGLVVEWNRWAEVEFLAADTAALEGLGERYLNTDRSGRDRLMAEDIDAWQAQRRAVR